MIWHDVECASYAADLPLWRELAAACGGAILDLGSGTGRVALDLAARGHDVFAIDSDPALVRTLAARARERGLEIRTSVEDIRGFDLGERFALAIAPMQGAQLLGGAAPRRRMLSSVRRHLRARGTLAVALADPLEGLPPESVLPPLPDVREVDGWVFSSTPVAVRAGDRGGVAIDRLRQAVSPAGELSESMAAVELDRLGASELESAAAEVGLRSRARHTVAPTAAYVGSTVVELVAV